MKIVRENILNEESISDIDYVVTFYKKLGIDISDIPLYVIDKEEWREGKPMQSENDREGGIRVYDDYLKIDSDDGWLIHEVGHVLDLKRRKRDDRDWLVSRDEFEGYPNAEDEQLAMYYHFKWMIEEKGMRKREVIEMMKRSYSSLNGRGSLWNRDKESFFGLYYDRIGEYLDKEEDGLNEGVLGLIKTYGKKIYNVIENPSTISQMHGDIRGISYDGNFYLVNQSGSDYDILIHNDIIDWMCDNGILDGNGTDYYGEGGIGVYENGVVAWQRSGKSNKFFLSESYDDLDEEGILDEIKDDCLELGRDEGDYRSMGDYYFIFERVF